MQDNYRAFEDGGLTSPREEGRPRDNNGRFLRKPPDILDTIQETVDLVGWSDKDLLALHLKFLAERELLTEFSLFLERY